MNQRPFNPLQPEPSRPRKMQLAASILLVGVGAFWGVIFDLPQVPALLALIVTAAATTKKVWILTRSALLYLALAAALAVAAGQFFFPFEIDRFGLLVAALRLQYLNPFALYAAGLLLFFPYPKLWAGLIPAAALFALCGAGDATHFSAQPARIPLDGVWLERHYHALFHGVAFAAALASILLIVLAEAAPAAAKPRRAGRRRGLKIAAAVAIAGIWLPLVQLYRSYEREIQNWENQLIFQLERNTAGQSHESTIYATTEVDLRRPAPGSGRDQAQILLRADGDGAPGYLRSSAYTAYDDGVWRPTPADAGPAPELPGEVASGLAAVRFRRPGAPALPAPARSWQIFWSDRFQAGQLPLPPAWATLELIAEKIEVFADGQVVAPDWLRAGGYRVEAAPGDAGTAWPLPRKPGGEYRQIPAALRPVLQATLDAIPGWDPTAAPGEKIAALNRWFEANFRYELDRRPGDGDPVRHFLETSRAGHCELFAAAAALLARAANIPTRYVTGFVCVEAHPSGRYFVARAGHAHAWIEFFDAEAGVWRTADPTPPGALPDFSGDWDFLNSRADSFRHRFNRFAAFFRNGEAAQWIRRTAFGPGGIVALAVLAALGVARFLRRRRPARPAALELTPAAARWSRAYRRWEKQMSKRGKFPVAPGGTAGELLARVEASAAFSAAEKAEAGHFVAAYRRGRFRPGEDAGPPR